MMTILRPILLSQAFLCPRLARRMGRSQPVRRIAPGATRRAALKGYLEKENPPVWRAKFQGGNAPTAERPSNLGDSAATAKIVELPSFALQGPRPCIPARRKHRVPT